MTLAELRQLPEYRALPRRLGKSRFGRDQLCAYLENKGIYLKSAPGFHWFVKGRNADFADTLETVARVFEPKSPIGSTRLCGATAQGDEATHILVFGHADDPDSWRGFAILQDKYGCETGRCGEHAGSFYLKLLLAVDKTAVNGRAFMEEIHRVAKRIGKRRVVCFAIPSAMGFYVKLGYRVSIEPDKCSSMFGPEPSELVPDVYQDERYMNFFNKAQRLGYAALLPKRRRNGQPISCRTTKECVFDGIYMSRCV